LKVKFLRRAGAAIDALASRSNGGGFGCWGGASWVGSFGSWGSASWVGCAASESF
jgi:hypothetical protein